MFWRTVPCPFMPVAHYYSLIRHALQRVVNIKKEHAQAGTQKVDPVSACHPSGWWRAGPRLTSTSAAWLTAQNFSLSALLLMSYYLCVCVGLKNADVLLGIFDRLEGWDMTNRKFQYAVLAELNSSGCDWLSGFLDHLLHNMLHARPFQLHLTCMLLMSCHVPAMCVLRWFTVWVECWLREALSLRLLRAAHRCWAAAQRLCTRSSLLTSYPTTWVSTCHSTVAALLHATPSIWDLSTPMHGDYFLALLIF